MLPSNKNYRVKIENKKSDVWSINLRITHYPFIRNKKFG